MEKKQNLNRRFEQFGATEAKIKAWILIVKTKKNVTIKELCNIVIFGLKFVFFFLRQFFLFFNFWNSFIILGCLLNGLKYLFFRKPWIYPNIIIFFFFTMKPLDLEENGIDEQMWLCKGSNHPSSFSTLTQNRK